MIGRNVCFATILLIIAGLPAMAGINTIPSWNGTNLISAFGIPNTQTYGQVVTIPSGAGPVTSFSFEMNVSTTLAFRGEIYAWDGAKATGASLFESAVTSSPAAGFQLITFNTGVGGIALPAGTYVFFASSSQDNSGHSGSGSWGSIGNLYGGGFFVYMNNGTDTSQWTSTAWTTISNSDLAFSVNFTDPSVPTLSEWALILLFGLLGLTGLFVIKRKLGNTQRESF
jgi:hypothetical protein